MTSPSPDSDLDDDFALIQAAVRAGGALARDHAGTDVKVLSKADGSPVSEIDLAVDKILAQHLRQTRPGYGWLSEESAAPFPERDKTRAWIVDPIDGTRAFLRGLPEFCVAACLVEHGSPILACAYNPMSEEFYVARRGGGATLNGAPIRVTDTAALEPARISTGNEKALRHFMGEDLPSTLIVERAMSLTLRFAHVAAGLCDAAIAIGPKADWDVAPGALFVAEAGGVARDHQGRAFTFNRPEPRQDGVVAAGPNLHPLLRQRLAPRGG